MAKTQFTPELGPESPAPGDEQVTAAEQRLEIARFVSEFVRNSEQSRAGGDPSRERTWQRNFDLYWGRHDFGDKAPWQSQEVMPEGMVYVDRFAASMTEALLGEPNWYEPVIEGDTARDFQPAMRRWMNYWLARVGTNVTGQTTDFFPVFEELCKLGALAYVSAVVLWKDGRVVIDPVDPFEIFLDNTGRRFGRARRYEIDKTELTSLAGQTDSTQKPLYDTEELMAVVRGMPAENENQKREMAGHARDTRGARNSVQIVEYYGDVLNMGGEKIVERSLMVVANEKFVIRGPEPNPYWHGDDWLVAAPIIATPLSVWGKTYAETWAGTARAFTDLTNLIMDGVFTTVLRVFAVQVAAIANAEALGDGISPNLTLEVEEGYQPDKILSALDMGHVTKDVMDAWAMLKRELQEGAMFSDIAVGQFPGKSDITATEVNASSAGTSALMRSIARGLESRVIEPILGLVWRVSLQKFNAKDPDLIMAVGAENVQAFDMRRKEFVDGRVTFRVTGISGSVDRALKLRALLNLLQVASQNPLLFQAFTQVVDIGQLFRELFRLHGIDPALLTLTERQRMIQGIVNAFTQAMQAGQEKGGAQGPDPAQAMKAAMDAHTTLMTGQEKVAQAQNKTATDQVTQMAKMLQSVTPPQPQETSSGQG